MICSFWMIIYWYDLITMDSIFASNMCILETFRNKHNPGAIILLLAIQFNLPISTDWDTSELTIVFGCPAIDLSSLISPFWGIPPNMHGFWWPPTLELQSALQEVSKWFKLGRLETLHWILGKWPKGTATVGKWSHLPWGKWQGTDQSVPVPWPSLNVFGPCLFSKFGILASHLLSELWHSSNKYFA